MRHFYAVVSLLPDVMCNQLRFGGEGVHGAKFKSVQCHVTTLHMGIVPHWDDLTHSAEPDIPSLIVSHKAPVLEDTDNELTANWNSCDPGDARGHTDLASLFATSIVLTK